MKKYKQIKTIEQWNRFFNSLKRGDIFEVLFDGSEHEGSEEYIEVFIENTEEGLTCFEVAKRYGPDEDWEFFSRIENFYTGGCLSAGMQVRRI